MAEAQIKLGYILDPFFQIENTNGKPVVGGHIEVFEAGTDTKYITYQNFDYTQNPFKIPLGSDGRAVVLGDSNLSYDVYIYDSFNNLIVSRLNVAAGDAGGVAGGGLRQIIHDDTMTGRGTQLSPLGVSPLTNLAVDDTMTAYEATVEGKESLVLGVNGDWFNEQFGSVFSGKLDTSSFNSAYYDIKGGLSSKVDWSAMSSYYNKNETYNYFLPRSAIDLTNYYTKEEVYNKNEVDSLLNYKQEKLEFNYDVNSVISAINGSALAGQGGEGSCPWISGAKIIDDTQTLTGNMLVQVLSSFDLSGYKNHSINVKGGMYRFPNNYEIASGINQTNTFLTQSAFNNYTNVMSDHLSILYGHDGYLSGRINELSSYAKEVSSTVKSNSGLWNQVNTAVNNYVTTKSANIDLATSLVIANETNWSDTTYTVFNNSAKWDDASNKVRSNSAQWAKNDGNTAVNNWVKQNSATVDMVTLGYLTNEANWNDTYYTVMTNSANWSGGGNTFPMTGRNGTTAYTHGANCSSFYLSNSVERAGSVVTFLNNALNFAAYPSTDVSASWYDIIKAANSNNITCSAVKLTTAASEHWFYTSALPNLNEITFIAPSYGPYGTYSAMIDDGDTIFVAEVDSGCCMKVVRNWNNDRNKNCWCGLNQETYFYIG